MQRCYVLDAQHDDLLRTRAAITGLTINKVAQQALDAFLSDMNAEALLTADAAPLEAGPDPVEPRRRTLAIRSDQADILRVLRLRFSIQASDVARQAIAAAR